MRHPKIIIIGGGLAGLMATIRVAESGVPGFEGYLWMGALLDKTEIEHR